MQAIAPPVVSEWCQDFRRWRSRYDADGKEVTVIVETIPDKKVLVDTGGPSLVTIGVFVALGLMGFGIYLLRRT